MAKFERYACERLDIARATPEEMVPELLRYAQFLYDTDASLGRLRQLLNGLKDFRFELGGRIGRAWDAVRTWEMLEPTCAHVPVPAALFKAMTAVALLLEWVDVAVMLLLMFVGLMRPGEAVSVTRADFVLPSDVLDDSHVVFVRISRHKNVLKAGQQHAAIRDRSVVAFFEKVLGSLPRSTRIFHYTPQTFRKRWDTICARIGVVSGADGFTPASLRAGGATYLYTRGVSIPKIRWLLRHAGESSTAHYIQEASAALASASLPRERVAVLARAAGALLRQARPFAPRVLPIVRPVVTFSLNDVVWTDDDMALQ
ncbi:MAG: site-specific integrase [Myxococcota bacterium]|nr:site-specific integrase [Myxococcota bacterium]